MLGKHDIEVVANIVMKVPLLTNAAHTKKLTTDTPSRVSAVMYGDVETDGHGGDKSLQQQ